MLIVVLVVNCELGIVVESLWKASKNRTSRNILNNPNGECRIISSLGQQFYLWAIIIIVTQYILKCRLQLDTALELRRQNRNNHISALLPPDVIRWRIALLWVEKLWLNVNRKSSVITDMKSLSYTMKVGFVRKYILLI